MDMLKALTLGGMLAATIALAIGSQGVSGGPLGIHLVPLAEARLYWFWPLFFPASGICWGVMVLQL